MQSRRRFIKALTLSASNAAIGLPMGASAADTIRSASLHCCPAPWRLPGRAQNVALMTIEINAKGAA